MDLSVFAIALCGGACLLGRDAEETNTAKHVSRLHVLQPRRQCCRTETLLGDTRQTASARAPDSKVNHDPSHNPLASEVSSPLGEMVLSP